MTKLTVDSILQAVLIERPGRTDKLYTPSPASMRRVLNMTCKHQRWVFIPVFYVGIFKWVQVAL